jgi:hypothetical protein
VDERALELAREALEAALEEDWAGAGAAVQAISDERGWTGVTLALTAWSDTLVIFTRRSQGLPDEPGPGVIVQPAWADDETGEVIEDADAVNGYHRWAGRLLAARAAMDHDSCEALLRSLPEDGGECGRHVTILLEMVALGMGHIRKAAAS